MIKEKVCSKCGHLLPIECFHKRKGTKDGYRGVCKDCRRFVSRRYHVKKLYGMTEADYNDMFEKQNHKCAICGKELERTNANKYTVAHVDHNHMTGKVRALLCSDCNKGLGFFKDNTELLDKAIAYLKDHG